MTSRSAQEQANIDLVQGFFDATTRGREVTFNYIDQNFTNNVRFPIVIQTSDYDENAHSHEANLINPGIFPFSGKEGAKEFVGNLFQFRQVLRFNIDKYIVDGNNVAVFGDYVHLSNTTNNFAVTPFALEVEILNGKIDLYHIREDSWASITAERDRGRWQRQFGGEPPLNVIFGGRFEDNLIGGNGEDLIYGYQLNDRINGRNGNDEIWGGSGNDNISGGNGNDTFVLIAGEGTDTITDFEDGRDRLGLARTSFYQWDGTNLEFNTVDLNFSDLTIGTQGADATVSVSLTSEVLAVIKGAAGLINENDFIKIPIEPTLEPPPTPADPTQPPAPDNEARNLEVVRGFFDSILNGTFNEYIDQNFTQDVQYVVVRANNDYSETSFFHERNRILPWTTLQVGPQAVKEFFGQLTTEFNILRFNVDKLFAEGNTVSVFGDFDYQNTRTEQLAKEIPFGINIVLENGKIDFYHFFEDSFTILTALRDDGNWNRFNQELVFGSRFEDNLTGTAGEDVIYGYQLADIINGGEGNDEIWGGSGNDNISGGNGNDTFVLVEEEGTDTIIDFVKGQDSFRLAGNLTFEQLTLAQNGTNTEISITATGEILATLTGVDASTLDTSDFISSATAPQLVFGTLNNDELNIVDASVIVFAGNGNDTVDASVLNSNAKDRIYAGNNDDEVFAGKNDRSFGGAGNDIIDASNGMGGNRLYGGAGNDEIVVKANERAFGGAGNDTIDASGSNGESRLYGNEGNDIFFLGSGDRLVGGAGDDQFYAGSGGGNTITGGQGAEQFWIVNAQLPGAANIITDFELGVDVIGVGGLGLNFNDLALTQQGENTLIATSGQNIAILLNIDSTSLSANNFVFV